MRIIYDVGNIMLNEQTVDWKRETSIICERV